MTSRSTWKAFERVVAAIFGTKRNPLSGANNRNDDGSERAGDVLAPKGLAVLIECKYRASHAHHTLFRDAQIDAEKHGVPKDHALLFTRVKREEGYLVVMTADLFKRMYDVPGVKRIFRKQKRERTDTISVDASLQQP